jgi:Spy/CpxP family protein refolding chaperone
MTIYKSSLIAVLVAGLSATLLPAFADEAIPEAFPAPPELGPAPEVAGPPEFAASFGLPIVEAPEADVLMLLEDGNAVFAFGGAGGPACAANPISLSDEQLEKIHSLKEDYLDAVGPKTVELASKHRRLKDALLSANLDPAKAKALQSDINSLKDEISNLKLQNRLDCLAVLTPEQRKELRSRMLRMHFHHHFHGGHGPGPHRWGHEMHEHEGPGPVQG